MNWWSIHFAQQMSVVQQDPSNTQFMNFSKDDHLLDSFCPMHQFPLTNHEQGYKLIKEEMSCQHATKTQNSGCVSFTGVDVKTLMYIRYFTGLLTSQVSLTHSEYKRRRTFLLLQ